MNLKTNTVSQPFFNPFWKENSQMKMFKTCFATAVAGLLIAGSTHAANIAWDGNGNSNNSGIWSTTPGDELNWAGDVNPGTGDVAQLLNVTTGTRTVTLQDATTVQALTMAQTAAGAVNELTLNAELTLSNKTALSMTQATGEPESLVVNLNGNRVTLSHGSNDFNTTTNTAQGTWNFNAAGSGYVQTSAANEQTLTNNFQGIVNVSADATIGRENTRTDGGANSNRALNINFASGADVNVTAGTLTFLNRVRSDGNSPLNVNNAGSFDITSGAAITLHRHSQNGTPTTTTTLANTGTLTNAGIINFQRTESAGNQVISNSGTFIVSGTDATINRINGLTPTFTNTAAGTLRGNSASDTLDYDNLSSSTRMTVTSSGAVSPGAGHDGTGTTSVGSLSLQDIDLTFTGVDSRLRLDISGTGAGQFDVLSLIAGDNVDAGDLTIDSTDTKLDLFYVNAFDPVAGYSITILNYGSVSGAFDLANNLTISGASGFAADSSNYSIAYGADSAVLTLIPEPASLALMGLGGLLMLGRSRREA